MSTPDKDRGDHRAGGKTAPSDRRAGWLAITMAVVILSAIIMVTEPRDDATSDTGTTEVHVAAVPALLRIVAHVIGWEQNRH